MKILKFNIKTQKRFIAFLLVIVLFVTLFANEQFDRTLAAAESGNPKACYDVSLCYQYGYLDVEPNNEKAIYWAQKAADAGISDADVDIGVYYLYFENNWEKASSHFEKAAKDKNAKGYYMLGLCYTNALSVPKDIKKGIDNLKKASKLGFTQADYQLGMLYYNSDDVKQDIKATFKYISKAAEGGIVEAQSMLGSMYWQGFGTAEDKKKGYEWFEKAAEQGNVHGMCVCGLELFVGELVEQDVERGFSYLYYAVQNGNAEEKAAALGELGFVYEQGLGVDVDDVKAQYYYSKQKELENKENKL